MLTDADRDYLAGIADGLGLEPDAVLAAASAAHPGRTITRAHLRATCLHIQRGRRAFVVGALTAALADND